MDTIKKYLVIDTRYLSLLQKYRGILRPKKYDWAFICIAICPTSNITTEKNR